MYLFPHEPHTVSVAPRVLEGWQSSWVQGITQELSEVPPCAESGVSKLLAPGWRKQGFLHS